MSHRRTAHRPSATRKRTCGTHTRRGWPLITACLLLAAPPAPDAGAQARGDQPADRTSGIEQEVQARDVPAPVRLGRRVELVRRRIGVVPAVVIARDARSYIDAIADWSLERRYPVLIDDGGAEARENIARFVRAFRPEDVLITGESDRGFRAPDIADLRAALAGAWGAGTWDALPDHFNALEFTPPGVVLTDASDPAWTAALALGAGRGQPIESIAVPPGHIGGRLGGDDLDAFLRASDNAVIRAAERHSAAWQSLGDDIEALTLCMNIPLRMEVGGNDVVALSDRLGRGDDERRWGWAGHLFGDEQTAAYRAMCALFLQPESVWLFDGYKNQRGFAEYDVQPAADMLRKVGLPVTVDDEPNASIEDWRDRTARPVTSGLIHVNSSGGRRYFNLNTGRGFASDIPALSVPAVVHFVHSFSAQNIGDPASIAHRWLAQGAYAYVGAVAEPYLSAFHPPSSLIPRLAAPAPLGAAARIDNAELWKIAIIGDPLLTLGPVMPRANGSAPIEGARSLEKPMQQALEQRDFETALRALVMLGRDADVVRVAKALRKDAPEDWTATIAEIILPAAHRTAQRDLFLAAFNTLDPETAGAPIRRDMLWQAMRPAISSTDDLNMLETLKRHVRAASAGADGVALARAYARVAGRDMAVSVLDSIMQATDNDAQKEALRRELSRLQRP